MTERINCNVCNHSNARGDIYCVNCGSTLPKETWDKRIIQPQKETTDAQYTDLEAMGTNEVKTITITKKKSKIKWYNPPKRVRPWYHPLEIFFWIGFFFYVVFRGIGMVIWFILKETGLYIAWCCCWGPPREWKRE